MAIYKHIKDAVQMQTQYCKLFTIQDVCRAQSTLLLFEDIDIEGGTISHFIVRVHLAPVAKSTNSCLFALPRNFLTGRFFHHVKLILALLCNVYMCTRHKFRQTGFLSSTTQISSGNIRQSLHIDIKSL